MADRIFIVRHGETEWSAQGRHTGRTDLALTPAGRQQALRLQGELGPERFELVLSSPLRRARETCELAGFGDRAELCDDLEEWDYGRYEGLTRVEILAQDPNWNLWRDGCPGGETPAQVGARADRVLARLRALDGNALAFAHGHVLRVLTARWLEMEPAAGSRFRLDAAELSILGHEHDNDVILRWNATR